MPPIRAASPGGGARQTTPAPGIAAAPSCRGAVPRPETDPPQPIRDPR